MVCRSPMAVYTVKDLQGMSDDQLRIAAEQRAVYLRDCL